MMVPDRVLSEQELGRELRAMRPEADAEFAARLDAWAAEGFPSPGRPGRRERSAAAAAPLRERLRTWVEGRPLLPVLAAAATVVIVGAVSVGVVNSLDSGPSGGAGAGGAGALNPDPGTASDQGQVGAAAGAAQESAPSTSGGTIEPLPPTLPAPPNRDQLKPGRERIQERSASMTLSTDPEKVAEVSDGVVEVTERYDGIVVSSQVNSSAARGRASFDLRIPTQNLRAALADLSDLASVSARNEGSLDITAPSVSAEERFGDAKAAADALVARLGEAGSADEIASIRAQLRAARAQLAAARSELASLKQRADYSTVAITVVGEGDSGGWSLGDAVDDATAVLEDIGGATLVALAVIVPLALIAAAAWFAYSRINRRRREKALDR